MLNYKTYNLPQSVNLTTTIIKFFINQFWNDVFVTLHSDTKPVHLILMCKVEYKGEMGYRTLGQSKFVNL